MTLLDDVPYNVIIFTLKMHYNNSHSPVWVLKALSLESSTGLPPAPYPLGHPGGAYVLITLLIKLMDQMDGHYQETLKRLWHGRMDQMDGHYQETLKRLWHGRMDQMDGH